VALAPRHQFEPQARRARSLTFLRPSKHQALKQSSSYYYSQEFAHGAKNSQGSDPNAQQSTNAQCAVYGWKLVIGHFLVIVA
jgi:hypothetical protein